LYVGINSKYLFIFYSKAKLLYILFVCFHPSINETVFICAEEGGCDLSQHIDIDFPDYTVSHRRRPKYEYSLQANRFHRYGNINLAIGIACCTLLCGIVEEVLLECIHAIKQAAHTLSYILHLQNRYILPAVNKNEAGRLDPQFSQ